MTNPKAIDRRSKSQWPGDYSNVNKSVRHETLLRKAGINDQCFCVRSSRDVLRELTLDIRRGELAAVMGPNGSGKSTAKRLLFCGAILDTARSR
ncbi:ATP-binding cassette domain-containing protein [Cohnella thermotolerans]|uniref:ATP-binding cassette domain-containing protein n=1 Tax=Cohnella thermotolerans TaxID=329858 RepID=UPI000A0010BA